MPAGRQDVTHTMDTVDRYGSSSNDTCSTLSVTASIRQPSITSGAGATTYLVLASPLRPLREKWISGRMPPH